MEAQSSAIIGLVPPRDAPREISDRTLRRWRLIGALLFPFTLLTSAISSTGVAETSPPRKVGEKRGGPIKKIDRKKVVGGPVLDISAKEGIYIWLEDGAYHVAAVTNLPLGTKKKRTRTFSFKLSSAESVTVESLGAFTKTETGKNGFLFRVVVGSEPERLEFKTEGEITISDVSVAGARSRPDLFAGPLAMRVGNSLLIGRY